MHFLRELSVLEGPEFVFTAVALADFTEAPEVELACAAGSLELRRRVL